MRAPIILVPGFWLGAWAWDEVADDAPRRRPRRHGADAAGHRVERRRPLHDHVPGPRRRDRRRARGRRARRSSSRSTARPGSAATRPATGPGADRRDGLRRHGARASRRSTRTSRTSRSRCVWADIAAEENLDGLSEEQHATFRERAVPVPGGVLREPYTFTNDARRDIPSTIIATGYSAADYQKYAKEHPGLGVPRRPPGAAGRHLGRPADQPLADVVATDRARRDHRGHRHEGRSGPPMSAVDCSTMRSPITSGRPSA